MRALAFFLLIVIGVTPARAFDRLYCQSDLKGWIVTRTDAATSAVLTPHSQHTTLSERLSRKLIVKDADSETVATLFPWNTLYVRVPAGAKSRYEMRSTETDSGFSFEVIEKQSKLTRSLDCRFTF